MHVTRSVPLFLGGGKKRVSEGRKEHQPCHLKDVLEETPLAITCLRLRSSLILWPQCSLGGKPSRTSPGAYKGAAAPWSGSLFPLSQSCRSAWAGLGVGHAAVGDVTTVHSPSAPVGVYLCSWSFKRAAGLSDCPIYLKSQPWRAAGCYVLLGADSPG